MHIRNSPELDVYAKRSAELAAMAHAIGWDAAWEVHTTGRAFTDEEVRHIKQRELEVNTI